MEGAIEGWYQDYLRATYENWPRRKRIWKVWWILPPNTKPLPKCSPNWFFSVPNPEIGSLPKEKDAATVHNPSIKGLEFPRFRHWVGRRSFPNKRAIDGEGDLEEERRLLRGRHAG